MDREKPGYIKWILIGCGCLTVISILVSLCIVLFAGGIIGGVMGAIKNSEAYKMSLEILEKSPHVREEIGNIKSYGWFPSGSVNVSGSTGDAKLSISVTGEKGQGILETELTKNGGKWSFTKAVFYPKNNNKEIKQI